MKRILIPLLFLTIVARASTMPVYATSGHSVQQIQSMSVRATSYMPTYEMRSMCVIPSGAHYTGTVYEPFNSAAPSEYVDGQATGGPHRGKKWDSGGFIPGPDTPPGQQYPIGEPWILLLFAAAFGGYIVWKKKKAITTSKEEI